MIGALASLVAADLMPIEELWKKLQEGEILSPDFDPEEAQAEIAAEVQRRQAYPQPPPFRGQPGQPGQPPEQQAQVQ